MEAGIIEVEYPNGATNVIDLNNATLEFDPVTNTQHISLADGTIVSLGTMPNIQNDGPFDFGTSPGNPNQTITLPDGSTQVGGSFEPINPPEEVDFIAFEDMEDPVVNITPPNGVSATFSSSSDPVVRSPDGRLSVLERPNTPDPGNIVTIVQRNGTTFVSIPNPDERFANFSILRNEETGEITSTNRRAEIEQRADGSATVTTTIGDVVEFRADGITVVESSVGTNASLNGFSISAEDLAFYDTLTPAEQTEFQVKLIVQDANSKIERLEGLDADTQLSVAGSIAADVRAEILERYDADGDGYPDEGTPESVSEVFYGSMNLDVLNINSSTINPSETQVSDALGRFSGTTETIADRFEGDRASYNDHFIAESVRDDIAALDADLSPEDRLSQAGDIAAQTRADILERYDADGDGYPDEGTPQDVSDLFYDAMNLDVLNHNSSTINPTSEQIDASIDRFTGSAGALVEGNVFKFGSSTEIEAVVDSASDAGYDAMAILNE